MPDAVNHSRRRLFRKMADPVINADTSEPKTPRQAPRPPKAVDEALFTRLCDGCNICVEKCPQQIIALENELAVVNVDFEHCTMCGECWKSCHSGALHVSQRPVLDVRPSFGDSCNNYVGLHCADCAQHCPTDAISVTDYQKPTLNHSLCNGCGQCKPSCYVSAIEMVL
jgi:ferredoxin-type protein NapF